MEKIEKYKFEDGEVSVFSGEVMAGAKIVFSDGTEVKLGSFDNVEELTKSHAWVSGILCCQFFEIISNVAKEQGVSPYKMFKSKEEFEQRLLEYVSDFVIRFVKNAKITCDENWERLFRTASSHNEA